jgi:hypothetical protein
MTKQRILAPAVVLLTTLLGACGSSSAKQSFSEQLQGDCRTVARSLRGIDEPAAVGDFQKAADDASSIYKAGVDALKKLKAPSNQSSDFAQLQSNMNDEIDVLGQISTAAGKGDDTTVSTKVSSLAKIDDDNSKLADSLDASSCAFQPVFTAGPSTSTTSPAPSTTTPSTTAPSTKPSTTRPSTTKPSSTEPGTTGSSDTGPGDTTGATHGPKPIPVDTTAAPASSTAPSTASSTSPGVSTTPRTTGTASGSNKRVVQLADQITPKGDYSFVDSADDPVSIIQTAMDSTPLMQSQPGALFGVDVVVDDIAITRVFGFVPDSETFTAGSVDALETTLAQGSQITPATIAGITGGTFTNAGNLFFVAEKGTTMVIVVGKDETSLEAGFTDFVESVGS